MSQAEAERRKRENKVNIGSTPMAPVRHRIAPHLDTLRPISIAEAAQHTNEICHGRVLFARTLTRSFRINAVQLLLGDDEGSVLRCGLYNGPPPGPDSFDSLPEGTPLALMEPYVKDSLSGRITLRCDHPQCVVVFKDEDVWEQVMEDPRRFVSLGVGSAAAAAVRAGLTSRALRQRGNELFQRGDVAGAVDFYEGAARAAGDDASARALGLSNGALCALKRRRWEAAERLAREALEADPTHVKSLYRLVVSLMWLGRWDEADTLSTGLDPAVPANERVLGTLETARRERKGVYNIAEIRSSKGASEDALPHANFVNPSVEEFQTADRGLGLRATDSIQEGDLVLADYALAVSRAQSGTITMTAGRSVDSMSQSVLLPLVLREAAGHPSIVDRLHRLAAGHHTADPLPDQPGAYDLVRIDAALRQNWFGAGEVPDAPPALDKRSSDDQSLTSGTGVWLEAAKINHSCAPNCEYGSFGAMLLVLASRPITAGEELTVPYRGIGPQLDLKARRTAMKEFGDGFHCVCQRCVAVESSPRLRTLEAKACAMYTAAMSDPAKGVSAQPTEGALSGLRAELAAEIGDGADRDVAIALGLPLAGIDLSLCHILMARRALPQVLEHAASALKLLKQAGLSTLDPLLQYTFAINVDVAAATNKSSVATKLLADMLIAGRRYGWTQKGVAKLVKKHRRVSTQHQLREVTTAASKTARST